MKLELFQVNAFTDRLFSGNPACVVPLTSWLPDHLLLKIARENAVAETAFFIRDGSGCQLRWFTPEIEMDLCGHATLATAHIIKTVFDLETKLICFKSKSGALNVNVAGDFYTLDFPSRDPSPATLPEIIIRSLSKQPQLVLKSRDYVLVYEHEQDVRDIVINRQIIEEINLDPGGVIITAKGNEADFVSRFFTPGSSIFEDPVTGSAHCSLIPYWAKRLQKEDMVALQLSPRGGKLYCTDAGERVRIGGYAKTYSKGNLWTE